MKKITFYLVFSIVIMWGLFTASGVLAQGGDPPPPPGAHGSSQNRPPGGGAPVGSGIWLLAACSLFYVSAKCYQKVKNSDHLYKN
jgi:hypothetical protein